MRAVIQRVSEAAVSVDGRTIGAIDRGVVVLLGVAAGDSERDAAFLADKVANLRIFPDEEDKMNRSLIDIGGEALVVSQFTLCGDCRKGRRPSYSSAAPPDEAVPLYEAFVKALAGHDLRVATGEFQAMMEVALVNDGPVTLLLDSAKRF